LSLSRAALTLQFYINHACKHSSLSRYKKTYFSTDVISQCAISQVTVCLQCFDAVGRMTGRASALENIRFKTTRDGC